MITHILAFLAGALLVVLLSKNNVQTIKKIRASLINFFKLVKSKITKKKTNKTE